MLWPEKGILITWPSKWRGKLRKPHSAGPADLGIIEYKIKRTREINSKKAEGAKAIKPLSSTPRGSRNYCGAQP